MLKMTSSLREKLLEEYPKGISLTTLDGKKISISRKNAVNSGLLKAILDGPDTYEDTKN
jgi:hypothetical protein